MSETELIRYSTITDMVEKWNSAMENFRLALESFDEANKTLESTFGDFVHVSELATYRGVREMAEVKRMVWRALLHKTGVNRIL